MNRNFKSGVLQRFWASQQIKSFLPARRESLAFAARSSEDYYRAADVVHGSVNRLHYPVVYQQYNVMPFSLDRQNHG